MNRNNLFFLSLVIIVLFNVFPACSQITEAQSKELLHKIDASLEGIKTVVYKINYTNKALSLRDTIHSTAICSLYMAPKDEMKAYNIVDLEFKELKSSTYGHRQYDGKRSFWVNYPVDSLNFTRQPYIDNKRKMRNAVVENYSSLLLSEYLGQKQPFGKYESYVGNILITEEVLNDTKVYVLTLLFKDNDGVSDHVEKHYIRKSDFLPVAHYSFMRWESMEQYNYYEVDYLSINPAISLEDFKIDKDEIIQAADRYKVFKEKANTKNL